MRRFVTASRAELRLREASTWLASREPSEEVLVVGATSDAASELMRSVALARGASFGWHRLTLGQLAMELAKLELARRDLAPIGALPVEALCARVLQRLRDEGRLGRLAAVVDQPGLPRALARTLTELRMAGAVKVDGDPALESALSTLDEELIQARHADRALVFKIATGIAADPTTRHSWLDLSLLFVDASPRTRVEQEFVSALVNRSNDVLATIPSGDERALRFFGDVASSTLSRLDVPPTDSLGRVQHHLFATEPSPVALDDTVTIMSAPGESRECVEIARRVLREAERGVPFDRMAVLLRSPEQYRVHLQEALNRADVPTHFDQGTVLPDPSGRAFLALIACAADRLSAKRFAEYLSLGEVPDATNEGLPPPPTPPGDRWIPPDEELLPVVLEAVEDEPTIAPVASVDGPVAAGTLRAPWRWERLIVEASVIGGRDRWSRRLDGLEARLRLDESESGRESRERRLTDLAHLRNFALPLLDDLAVLPAFASWGEWLDRLSALATRALRHPERVLGLLAALAPMRDVGPVDLADVQLVLYSRLSDLVAPPVGRRYGRLFVAPIEAARGHMFDIVFVPGLAERMFPQKIAEDPLLLDADRARLGLGLPVRDDRLADERLALRLAIGAASKRVVLSYPRIDLDQGRPRVPSFYGLEVLEAAEGTLPDFDELGRRADVTGAARIGWPAPPNRIEAIDEAEHDLALLDGLVTSSATAPIGAAAYLLGANPHLARALRSRARRWEIRSWKPADGLIVSTEEARATLATHAPSARSFSPTALEQLAACPYRFALRAIARLEAREDPEPIESLGALERGSLVHEIQFELLRELREAGLLPVRPPNLEEARHRLDDTVDRVAARYRDELCPAIDRVWNDGVASIRADVREWLRRMSEDSEWVPLRFELAFGLVSHGERDTASVESPVSLPIGLSLRGSIDLVEEGAGPALRATDYKTGKARVEAGTVIEGGTSLQPILYALALEQLFPGTVVAGGRLHYCTARGDFQQAYVPLDAVARNSAQAVADTLKHHFDDGFFPAAPVDGACGLCDFRTVCGPYEETRADRKDPTRLAKLVQLRGMK